MSRTESDLADVISSDDRERIMETEKRLMESSICSIKSGGQSEGEEGRIVGKKGSGIMQRKISSRRRRRLPEIPKNKKRKKRVKSGLLKGVPAKIYNIMFIISWVQSIRSKQNTLLILVSRHKKFELKNDKRNMQLCIFAGTNFITIFKLFSTSKKF
jgi:hypothetical protein